MDPDDAARALLTRLAFPRHLANVWVWNNGTGVVLVVRLDPYLMYRSEDVPGAFAGYPVKVERRGEIVAPAESGLG